MRASVTPVRRVCGLLLVAVVLLAGCKVDARVDVRLNADGSGIVLAKITLDAEAVQRLTTGGSLATAVPLDDLRDAGWHVSEWKTTKSGAASITLSRAFVNQDGLARRLEDLTGPNGALRDARITRHAWLVRCLRQDRGHRRPARCERGREVGSRARETVGGRRARRELARRQARLRAQRRTTPHRANARAGRGLATDRVPWRRPRNPLRFALGDLRAADRAARRRCSVVGAGAPGHGFVTALQVAPESYVITI